MFHFVIQMLFRSIFVILLDNSANVDFHEDGNVYLRIMIYIYYTILQVLFYQIVSLIYSWSNP